MKTAVKKPRTKFHGAVRSLYEYFFAKYIKRGDIELHAEFELSKAPRRIDIVVIKKKLGVVIDTLIGRIFRGHNIVEFKSPADAELTMHEFNKVVHLYAGGYAWHEEIMLSDMTATIVCYKKPTALFESLEKDFSYKIKRGDRGIYYIELKGVPIEKTLRIQMIVSPELSDEYWELNALARELRPEELPKFSEIIGTQEGRALYASDWGDTVTDKSKEILKKEDKMVSKKVRMEIAKAWGLDKELVARGRQEGMQEGMQRVLSLIKNGVPLTEVERQLQPA